jgi:4-hydroxy-tetrahydrodipicolinate synthase
MSGCANTILASYTSDLQGLNEAGIRHDVRWEIEHGFRGALVVGETALTVEEYLQFMRVAADEAQGRLHLVHHACFNTLGENIAVANASAEAGADLALLTYPPSFHPKSSDDIYRYTKTFCDATDLGVVLFPVPLWGFERIHPASIAPDVIERLVDECPNVVAIKAEGGFPSLGGFVHLHQLVGDRVIVTMPVEEHAIPLKMMLELRWMGTSCMEYLGGAVPRMFDLVEAGKNDEAWDLFWQIDPARRANRQVMAFTGANFAHRMLWKYLGWLSGMNGGPLRMPTMRANDGQFAVARNGLARSGLDVTEDTDDLFHIGRVQQ